MNASSSVHSLLLFFLLALLSSASIHFSCGSIRISSVESRLGVRKGLGCLTGSLDVLVERLADGLRIASGGASVRLQRWVEHTCAPRWLRMLIMRLPSRRRPSPFFSSSATCCANLQMLPDHICHCFCSPDDDECAAGVDM